MGLLGFSFQVNEHINGFNGRNILHTSVSLSPVRRQLSVRESQRYSHPISHGNENIAEAAAANPTPTVSSGKAFFIELCLSYQAGPLLFFSSDFLPSP